MESVLFKLIAFFVAFMSAKNFKMILIYYLTIYFIVRAILCVSYSYSVDSIESTIILLFMIDFYSEGGLK